MTRQEAADIYRTHSKAIYNTALRIVRNPDEAEEIMQDTLMKFFQKESRDCPSRNRLPGSGPPA